MPRFGSSAFAVSCLRYGAERNLLLYRRFRSVACPIIATAMQFGMTTLTQGCQVVHFKVVLVAINMVNIKPRTYAIPLLTTYLAHLIVTLSHCLFLGFSEIGITSLRVAMFPGRIILAIKPRDFFGMFGIVGFHSGGLGFSEGVGCEIINSESSSFYCSTISRFASAAPAAIEMLLSTQKMPSCPGYFTTYRAFYRYSFMPTFIMLHLGSHQDCITNSTRCQIHRLVQVTRAHSAKYFFARRLPTIVRTTATMTRSQKGRLGLSSWYAMMIAPPSNQPISNLLMSLCSLSCLRILLSSLLELYHILIALSIPSANF